jgi:predicted nucleotidyltransferase
MTLDDRIRVFAEAQTVVRVMLEELDRRAPALITDVYIVGSLALDDARPEKSDIDIILVRQDTATNEESMEALRPVMELMGARYPRPALDGIVLSRADLAGGHAAMKGPRPVIFEGKVTLHEEGSARNPVTWQVLRQGGITWRGTPVSELHLHDDPAGLRAWTQGNLRSYWQPWLAKSRSVLSPFGIWSLRPDFVEWGVLGVTRLHATLATGKVVSKTGAGQYALETFPDYWHRIVREAIDIRADPERNRSLYRRDVLGRRKEARDYIAMVLEDALAL